MSTLEPNRVQELDEVVGAFQKLRVQKRTPEDAQEDKQQRRVLAQLCRLAPLLLLPMRLLRVAMAREHTDTGVLERRALRDVVRVRGGGSNVSEEVLAAAPLPLVPRAAPLDLEARVVVRSAVRMRQRPRALRPELLPVAGQHEPACQRHVCTSNTSKLNVVD